MKRRATIAALLLVPLIAWAGIITQSGARLFVTAPSGEDLYPFYTALDLNEIPFHTASGDYGAQLAIQAPTAPTITSTSNAADCTALLGAVEVVGRQVTVTADFAGCELGPEAIEDVEIIVPSGRLLNGLTIGNSFTGTTIDRLRVTKQSGDTIGGQIQSFWIIGADGALNDIIIDGIQISADSGCAYDGTSLNRYAFLRNRIRAAVCGYGYGGRHGVFAGNSVEHDANDTIDTGDWGFRQGAGDLAEGPYIFFQNDIRGAHYAKIRTHPVATPATPTYTWVAENTFESLGGGESRFVDLTGTSSTVGYPKLDAGWMLNNVLWTNNDAGGVQMDVGEVDYVRVQGNTINGTTTGLNSTGASDGVVSGNTYNADPGTPPAWGAAGDPTGIDYTP